MAIHGENIRFGDEAHVGFLCYPERAEAPLPAVLVLQEAWGLDEHIEEVARRVAASGYVALAPDLYAERGQRPEPFAPARMAELRGFIDSLPPGGMMDPAARDTALAARPEPERIRITETMAAMFGRIGKLDPLVPALLAATGYLRRDCTMSRGQKVASVGFCLGGGLSALLACHDPELAAAVIFYGSAPPAELVPRIACPVLGLYGGEDARINAGIPGLAEAMGAAGKRFEHVVYPGAQHAFFNDGRPSYQAAAARDAWVRTLTLFRQTLG